MGNNKKQRREKIIEINSPYISRPLSSNLVALAINLIPGALFFLLQLGSDFELVYASGTAIIGFALMVLIIWLFNTRVVVFATIVYLISSSGVAIVEYQHGRTQSYSLLTNCVHLGDKELAFFEPPEPLGDEISFTVTLPAVPKEAYFVGRFKDVDPDPRNGPLLLGINGADFLFVNSFFSDVPFWEEHTVGWRTISAPIPQGFIKKGDNTITLKVLPTIYGLDDVNFCDLALIVKP